MSTTELAGLLRGAIGLRAGWHDGIHPYVNNDALLVAADWCEEQGRGEEAAMVREAVALPFYPDGYDPARFNGLKPYRLGPEPVRRPNGSTPLGYTFQILSEDRPRGAAPLIWEGVATAGAFQNGARYRLSPSEVSPPSRGVPARPSRAGLVRVFDLARWHCVCCLLGHPPGILFWDEALYA